MKHAAVDAQQTEAAAVVKIGRMLSLAELDGVRLDALARTARRLAALEVDFDSTAGLSRRRELTTLLASDLDVLCRAFLVLERADGHFLASARK